MTVKTREEDFATEYMFLSRCKMDCNTYIYHRGFKWGQRRFWGGETIQEHIAEMRRLYDLLPVKPKWLPLHKIKRLERKMLKIEYLESIKPEEPKTKYCECCGCVH